VGFDPAESSVFTAIKEERTMKTLRLLAVCMTAAFPATVMATVFTSETASVPITRSTDASVDEVTFEWADAMVLAAADPCASYLAPRYDGSGNEVNYDDNGKQL
jgi:hypothetical protein